MGKDAGRPSSFPAREPLWLEPLEERIAPSGGITVIVSGGSLRITGDAGDNDFSINQTGLGADEYRVTSGGDATLINGQAGPLVFSGVTRDVSIRLNDGDDSVDLYIDVGRNVLIDGGKGNDSVDLIGGAVNGNFTARMGDGNDGVTLLGGGVTGHVKIDAGKGDDGVYMDEHNVEGNVGIRMGDGSDEVTLSNYVTVGRDLTIDGGKGFSSVGIMASTFFGNVQVKGSTGDHDIDIGPANFLKGLSILTGKGDVDVNIKQVEIGLTGRGYDLKVVNGPGNGVFEIDTVLIGRNFMWTQGPGNMSGLMDGVETGGSAQVKSSTGNDELVILNTDIWQKMQIMTGKGDLTMDIGGVTSVGGSGGGYDARITNGNGTADIDIRGTSFGGNLFVANGNAHCGFDMRNATVHKNFTSRLGGVADEFLMVGTTVEGKTSVSTGSGGDSIVFDGLHLDGPLSVNTGAGNDSLCVDAYYDYFGGPVGVFEGPVSIILGSGDDGLCVGVGGVLHGCEFYDRVFANGGGGYDYLDYQTGNNTFAVEPKAVGFEDVY